MKKLVLALSLVVVLVFAWAAPVSASDYPGANWATYFVYEFGTGPVSAPLIMGNGGPTIGTVTVTEESGNLVIFYDITANVAMEESHLAVTSGANVDEALDKVPHGGGGPIPGQFQNLAGDPGCYGAGRVYDPAVKNDTYSVSLATFGDATGVVILTHASIDNGETAWSDDPPLTPPVPELPAAALFGLGLAGITAFIFISRRKAATVRQ